jgi:hypothetical protein
MKTAPVKALVRDVLDTLPSLHSEHMIDEVLFAIETNPRWRRRYDALCESLGKPVVNQWCGQWTGYALGKKGETQVSSRKNSLSNTYSLLDTDIPVPLRLPSEDEARHLMASYFYENKARLPSDIRQRREAIIAMIMEGIPVDDAFALASQKPPPG